LPVSVLVEANSLFEAAAAGIEQIHKAGGLVAQVTLRYTRPFSGSMFIRGNSKDGSGAMTAMTTLVHAL